MSTNLLGLVLQAESDWLTWNSSLAFASLNKLLLLSYYQPRNKATHHYTMSAFVNSYLGLGDSITWSFHYETLLKTSKRFIHDDVSSSSSTFVCFWKIKSFLMFKLNVKQGILLQGLNNIMVKSLVSINQ